MFLSKNQDIPPNLNEFFLILPCFLCGRVVFSIDVIRSNAQFLLNNPFDAGSVGIDHDAQKNFCERFGRIRVVKSEIQFSFFKTSAHSSETRKGVSDKLRREISLVSIVREKTLSISFISE